MRSLASAHALAGSSCGVRGVAALPVRLGARRRCPAPPCRVTNTSDEIYKQLKLKQLGDEDEWVQVNDMQVLYPELGSLEGRVTAQFLDEMLGGKGPDLEETAYWFHTPEEGWKQETSKYQQAPELPVTFADPGHEEWEAEGRTPLSQLEEGQVITGEITDIWLYHGCQIDFGFEYDGLIPMYEDDWMEPGVRETLMPGDQVVAKVYKIRTPGLYRWPIQLEMLEPAHIAENLMRPELYQAPINHDWALENEMDMEDIVEATGRDYKPTNYLIPQDDAEWARDVQQAYGFDVENENPEDAPNKMEERISFKYAQEISQIAAELHNTES